MIPVTFRELAAVICKIDDRPFSDIERVTQQIRGAHQRKLIGADDFQSGARGAFVVSEMREACRVRMLLALVDVGLSGDDLLEVNGRLNLKTPTSLADGNAIPRSFGEVVDRIARGHEWVLRIEIIRCSGVYGKIDGALAYRVDFRTPEEAIAEDPTVRGFAEVHPGTLIAHVKMQMTRMLGPMIDTLTAHA